MAPAFGPGRDPGDPGSDRIPLRAPGAWSLLLPLPVSLPLSLSLSLCVMTIINKKQTNKQTKKNKNKKNCPRIIGIMERLDVYCEKTRGKLGFCAGKMAGRREGREPYLVPSSCFHDTHQYFPTAESLQKSESKVVQKMQSTGVNQAPQAQNELGKNRELNLRANRPGKARTQSLMEKNR